MDEIKTRDPPKRLFKGRRMFGNIDKPQIKAAEPSRPNKDVAFTAAERSPSLATPTYDHYYTRSLANAVGGLLGGGLSAAAAQQYQPPAPRIVPRSALVATRSDYLSCQLVGQTADGTQYRYNENTYEWER